MTSFFTLASSVALLPAEALFNSLIATDPVCLKKLQRLDDKVLQINTSQPRFTLSIRFISNSVKLSLLDRELSHLNPDATISGKLVDLLTLATNQSATALANPAITISGDGHLVQDYYEILNSLEIDFAELFAPLLGDISANHLATASKNSQRWVEESRQRLRSTVTDYLQEERHLTPTQNEVDAYFNQLDELGLQIDRLAARTELFKDRLQAFSDR